MRTLIKAAVRIALALMAWSSFLLLAQTIISLANLFAHPAYITDPSAYYFIVLPFAIFLAAALILIFLWRKTDWLVGVLAGNMNETELVINTTNLDLITVVLRIFGMCLILTSLPTLAGQLANQAIIKSSPFMGAVEVQARTFEGLISTGGTILIGVWLLYGGKGIVEEVDRQVTRSKKSPTDDTEAPK
jgi:hypothetical protein